jgi:hypothetical protein
LVADPKKSEKFLLRPSATNAFISTENKTGNIRINVILGQIRTTTVGEEEQ